LKAFLAAREFADCMLRATAASDSSLFRLARVVADALTPSE
jgi:hypothetical protein